MPKFEIKFIGDKSKSYSERKYFIEAEKTHIALAKAKNLDKQKYDWYDTVEIKEIETNE